MKINGALKPRQGASSLGSSPGVVLRKYRDKRYYKVNGNVVKGLPLIDCGIKNYNNKHQHNQQMKCAENTRSLCSSSVNNYNKNNNNYNNNNNSTQYRITTAANIDYKSHGSRKTTTATAAAAAATTINHNEEDVVEFKQKPVRNITTRQGNKKNTINKATHNEKEKGPKAKLTEVIRSGLSTATKSNTSKYHVTSYNNNNNSNNSNISFRKGVNKFLLISNIYENLILCALKFVTVIICWLFIHFKLLLFYMFSHTETSLTGHSVGVRSCCESGGGVGAGFGEGGSAGGGAGSISFASIRHNLSKIMRASQPFKKLFDRICFKNVNKSRLPPSLALCMIVYAAAAILLPQPVVGDDGDNFYPINGLETTTPEFDYASRGQKKFGDKCENTLECGFPGSVCDPKKKSCQCTEDLPVTNHIDKCGKEAAVNESCFFNEQCEVKYFQTECRDQRCVCRFDMSPIWLKDGTVECKGRGEKKPERYIDPAMIGVLIGMALMFIIICVVLRLFSQARWRENRTIFNTPNPRLMNVSLLRESKLLHGQERRGSRMSVRAPSRQPSMASLRPHSPNPSLGKTGSRSNSHGSSVSATSLRSTRSNSVSPAGIVVNNTHHERKGSTYQPHHHHHHPPHQHQQQPPQQQDDEHEQKQPLTQTNITSNPVAESITVEIIEPQN